MSFPRAPFDSVFSDESGGNIKTPQSDYAQAGVYPIVDQGKGLIGGYTDDSSRLCGGGKPAIVFGDHTRCIKYIDFPFCMGADGVKVLRPKIDADLKYLFYYLRSLNLPSAGYDRHFKYLKRQEVALPPLLEQRRIAAILDQADALRAKRREAIAELDKLAQAVFVDMFGGDSDNSKLLPEAPLGELVRVKSGEFLPATAMAIDGDVPVFGGNGINGHHDKALFEQPMIVIGRVGAYCGCIHVTPNRCWVTDNALVVIEMAETLQFEYLAFALSQAKLNRTASKFGQPLISASRINPILIRVPDLALQRVFASRLEAINSLKATHGAALAETDALFASLQHRAFNGEL